MKNLQELKNYFESKDKESFVRVQEVIDRINSFIEEEKLPRFKEQYNYRVIEWLPPDTIKEIFKEIKRKNEENPLLTRENRLVLSFIKECDRKYGSKPSLKYAREVVKNYINEKIQEEI